MSKRPARITEADERRKSKSAKRINQSADVAVLTRKEMRDRTLQRSQESAVTTALGEDNETQQQISAMQEIAQKALFAAEIDEYQAKALEVKQKIGKPVPWRIHNTVQQWDPKYCEMVFYLIVDPYTMHTVTSAMGLMNLSLMTFENWKKTHPEFLETVRVAMAIKEALLAGRLSRGMTYSAGLGMVMKNLFRWRENPEDLKQTSIGERIAKLEAEQRVADWDDVDAEENRPQNEKVKKLAEPLGGARWAVMNQQAQNAGRHSV